jgi:N-acetylglucosamine kinase-like BadF-type ATPase
VAAGAAALAVTDLLLGVDGGNTKTIAIVATRDGRVIGSGRSLGTADIHATTFDVAMGRIAGAVDVALRAAGVRHDGTKSPAIATAAFSLAGADWPEDVDELRARLSGTWPAQVVVNDAIGALRATIPHGPGVVVVCGTGAATGARGPEGRTWHTSFWQEPQGARELGEKTLRAIARADLGIDSPTRLTELVLAALDAPDVETVLHRRTRRGPHRWTEPAILAPLLLDAAEDGDATAMAIVRAHGEALGIYALAAARRVGATTAELAVALAGGVFRHPGALHRQAMLAAVRRGAPLAHEVRRDLEPVAGALLLAFDAAAIDVDGDVAARLHATLPEAALYETHPRSVMPPLD